MILTALLIADAALRGGLVLVDAVVDDLQDLDGTERSAEAAKCRELVRVDLWHTLMMPVVRLGGRRSSVDRQIRSLGMAGKPASSWKGSAAQESRPLR